MAREHWCGTPTCISFLLPCIGAWPSSGNLLSYCDSFLPLRAARSCPLQVCRTFAQTGTCPYGTRCRFIHHDATLASLKSPASRGSSTSSLNALLQEQPRVRAKAGGELGWCVCLCVCAWAVGGCWA